MGWTSQIQKSIPTTNQQRPSFAFVEDRSQQADRRFIYLNGLLAQIHKDIKHENRK
jgi:hypothetical protein